MSAVTAADASASVSRWHLLRHTPLRDLLRLRLSGRLDIEAGVAAAELPVPLTELLRTTVRRTRLWRIEKVEVARELAAHFQDGIEAGATADELVRSFGDPRQAARLIRRAKRRNRPAAWKALGLFTRAFLALIAVVFLTYIGLVVRLYLGEPTLSRNYLAELNAPVLAIPEDQRAWPLYRKAYFITDPVPAYDRLNPSDENWPELVAYAERHREAIQLYHAAARRAHVGLVHGPFSDLEPDRPEDNQSSGVMVGPAPASEENPPFISVLLPELSLFRQAAKLLTIDAHVAAVASDGERAYKDIETIFGIIEHSSETPILVSDLVAIAILRLNVDTIGMILRDQPELFSDEQLVQLSHRLAAVRGGGPLRLRMISERWLFEDLVQRLYTDDGGGDGHLVPEFSEVLASAFSLSSADEFPLNEMLEGASGPFVKSPISAVIADRAKMLAKHRELMDAWETEARTPLWEREELGVDREIMRMRDSTIERIRYLPIMIMMPSLLRASLLAELATQERDATLAALACELYRRRTGHWPASLADLSPRYLPSVPVDRFDGEPLRYQLTDGHPVLYSIGMDLDDDGGRLPEGEDRKRANRKAREWRPPSRIAAMKAINSPELIDGDWVLWPPVD